eukprot:NODE_8_length_66115_cov_0.981823.p6 type:complete len:657 gc:universal NODE_8_length_66115_cov_0.981823:64155-62185(-)
MEEKPVKRSSTSASTARKSKSHINDIQSTNFKANDLNMNINIGSLEEDMMSFLKTTEVPKQSRNEEHEHAKKELQKSQALNIELQEQLKKLKDLSRKALEDFDHYKHSMELEKVRYREALYHLDELKKNSCTIEEFSELQQTKSYLEDQLQELKDELMLVRQSKIQVEKQLDESRQIIHSYELQLSGFKNTAESETKTKQQLSSFNSEIGKELKQLTQSKKDLEISLQIQLEKVSRLQMQLSTLDNEFIKVVKDLDKEREEHRFDLEKLRSLEINISGIKKQHEIIAKEKEDKSSDYNNLKLKYELLIGELHVKLSELEKQKSDSKYEENLRNQSEKQCKVLQEMLRKRAENGVIASDSEIAKLLSLLAPLEEQKNTLTSEIKSLIADKATILTEIREKVKEYEVCKFRQNEVVSTAKKSEKFQQPTSPESPREHDIDAKGSRESLENVSNSNLAEDKGKKEFWRDKANNLIKKQKQDEDDQPQDINRAKTLRLMEGSLRAKQLKGLAIAKLKKQKVVLFGGFLQERADFEGKPIPNIVTACLRVVDEKGLKTEGIYRRAGAMKEMKNMQDEWEQGNTIDMAHDLIDVLSVSSLLKAYFRDLKIPLISTDIYETTVYILKEPKPSDDSLIFFKNSIKKLLPSHYYTLYYLIQHLQR